MSTWPEYGYTLGTGAAHLSLHGREVSEGDRKQWAWEDRARDARRLPLGFRAPVVAKAKEKAKGAKPRAKS